MDNMGKVDIWLIVGTRRWARLMASELCKILPLDTVVYLQGSLEEPELRNWHSASPFKNRIFIVEQPPRCSLLMTGVAFIVNSAYQHREAIQNAFADGYNVVSEKPITFSQQDTLDLIVNSENLKLKLFSTNTYLFADYLHLFRQGWLVNKKFTNIVITWKDAPEELRYGDRKYFDSSVPIIFDIMPHIANIILATYGEIKPNLSEVCVHRGGSEVSIGCADDHIRVRIQIARNATERVRIAKFFDENDEVVIDFTKEPGTVITERTTPVSADPVWQTKSKPIGAMMTSVREYFESGTEDPRLSPYASVIGNKWIDSIAESYVNQQVAFLRSNNHKHTSLTNLDLAYALNEAQSIRQRAYSFLSEHSPLRRLANAGRDIEQH